MGDKGRSHLFQNFPGTHEGLRRAAASSALNSGGKMFTAEDRAFRGRATPHSAADALNTDCFLHRNGATSPAPLPTRLTVSGLPAKPREAILSRVIEGLQGHGLQGHIRNSVT